MDIYIEICRRIHGNQRKSLTEFHMNFALKHTLKVSTSKIIHFSIYLFLFCVCMLYLQTSVLILGNRGNFHQQITPVPSKEDPRLCSIQLIPANSDCFDESKPYVNLNRKFRSQQPARLLNLFKNRIFVNGTLRKVDQLWQKSRNESI